MKNMAKNKKTETKSVEQLRTDYERAAEHVRQLIDEQKLARRDLEVLLEKELATVREVKRQASIALNAALEAEKEQAPAPAPAPAPSPTGDQSGPPASTASPASAPQPDADADPS
jgi:hypothetical protein